MADHVHILFNHCAQSEAQSSGLLERVGVCDKIVLIVNVSVCISVVHETEPVLERAFSVILMYYLIYFGSTIERHQKGFFFSTFHT